MPDFRDSHLVNQHNIQPMPNPKPLSVIRCSAEVHAEDGKAVGGSTLALITNVKVLPAELLRR